MVLADSLAFIRDNIATWWDFMWQTDIPGTYFSFGALYAFLIILSLGLFVMRLAINRKDKDGK